MTRVLARAFAPRVRVNSIAPGLIMKSSNTSEGEWHNLVSKLPVQRTGTTDELGITLEFLITNEYITGQTIVVDGGYSLL